MVRHPKDTRTGDLLSWTPPKVAIGYAPEVAGKASLHGKIARVVAQALRNARDNGMDRAMVAAGISEIVGRKVAPTTLDKFASEADLDRQMPVDVLIALIEVTGEDELMGFIPAMFNHVVVDEKYTDVIELTLLREHRSELDERERALAQSVRRMK